MRVQLKTKNKGVKHATYPCRKCDKPIAAGQKYYQWQHRNAPPSRQHAEHGAPRQSELCTGKMSGVYAATEGVEDAVKVARDNNDPTGLADALRTAAEEVENVRQEYEDGLGNMPDQLQYSSSGEQIQEKIDALESFKDELESAADEVETGINEWEELRDNEPEQKEEHAESCPVAELQEGECDAEECGKDAAEEEHEQWEQEIGDKFSEICDRVDSALGELSI